MYHTIQVTGKSDQGHEADFSQWSLPEQFIEMLRALYMLGHGLPIDHLKQLSNNTEIKLMNCHNLALIL